MQSSASAILPHAPGARNNTGATPGKAMPLHVVLAYDGVAASCQAEHPGQAAPLV